jgi:hypothetical protein
VCVVNVKVDLLGARMPQSEAMRTLGALFLNTEMFYILNSGRRGRMRLRVMTQRELVRAPQAFSDLNATDILLIIPFLPFLFCCFPPTDDHFRLPMPRKLRIKNMASFNAICWIPTQRFIGNVFFLDFSLKKKKNETQFALTGS